MLESLVPQLYLYIPGDLAAQVRRRAEAQGVSVSRYLAELVAKDIPSGWPSNFFREVVGGWVGERLRRAAQPKLERRDKL